MTFFINITGRINSAELWQHIEPFRVNLTDMDGYSLVYGEADPHTTMRIILICSNYGRLSIELSSPQ